MSIVKDCGIHVKVFSDSTTTIACINKLGTSHSKIVPSYYKANWNGQRKKTYILQLPIYQVIRILMEIGNPGNCHMTWNECFALKCYIKL